MLFNWIDFKRAVFNEDPVIWGEVEYKPVPAIEKMLAWSAAFGAGLLQGRCGTLYYRSPYAYGRYADDFAYLYRNPLYYNPTRVRLVHSGRNESAFYTAGQMAALLLADLIYLGMVAVIASGYKRQTQVAFEALVKSVELEAESLG